jgi:hypothetical protein
MVGAAAETGQQKKTGCQGSIRSFSWEVISLQCGTVAKASDEILAIVATLLHFLGFMLELAYRERDGGHEHRGDQSAQKNQSNKHRGILPKLVRQPPARSGQ